MATPRAADSAKQAVYSGRDGQSVASRVSWLAAARLNPRFLMTRWRRRAIASKTPTFVSTKSWVRIIRSALSVRWIRPISCSIFLLKLTGDSLRFNRFEYFQLQLGLGLPLTQIGDAYP